jgi:hypothetical protein
MGELGMKPVKIFIRIKINDGPEGPPIKMYVQEGDVIHIQQPVLVTFRADGVFAQIVTKSCGHQHGEWCACEKQERP